MASFRPTMSDQTHGVDLYFETKGRPYKGHTLTLEKVLPEIHYARSLSRNKTKHIPGNVAYFLPVITSKVRRRINSRT